MMEYRNVFKKIKQILFIPKIKVKRDVTPLSQDHLPSYLKEGRDLEGILRLFFVVMFGQIMNQYRVLAQI
jgi:hypothetical protein